MRIALVNTGRLQMEEWAMTTSETRGSTTAGTSEPGSVIADPEVVSTLDRRRLLADQLRGAVGFRVDGPEGRIGVVRAVAPQDNGTPPGHIRVAMGLFIVKEVWIAVADVVRVDLAQRRVHVRVMPKQRRLTGRALERRVRRFVRAYRS